MERIAMPSVLAILPACEAEIEAGLNVNEIANVLLLSDAWIEISYCQTISSVYFLLAFNAFH